MVNERSDNMQRSGRSLRWALDAILKNELVLSLVDCLFFALVLGILILCTKCTPL